MLCPTVHASALYLFQDTAIGTTIATVAATDDDHGSDGLIVFTFIDGNSEGRFQIDPKSGVIELRKQLDRETTEMYSLIVQAADHGSPSLSSTATVNVTVLDINDNAPLCNHSSYVIEVAENFTVNGTVVSLQCSDADQGQNSVIMYNISSGSTITKYMAKCFLVKPFFVKLFKLITVNSTLFSLNSL